MQSGCLDNNFDENEKKGCYESAIKYKEHQYIDPYRKKISPSLLNPHDIKTYIEDVGIIYPFIEG